MLNGSLNLVLLLLTLNILYTFKISHFNMPFHANAMWSINEKNISFLWLIITGPVHTRDGFLCIPGILPIQGGLPIVIGGRVIGGIGVSGLYSDLDEQIAKAGLEKLQSSLRKLQDDIDKSS